MVWGETTFDEGVATVHEAIAAGINLIDLAPRYGDGKAEEVVGEAFRGRLPQGVRVTSKCNLGNTTRAEIEPLLRQSIEGSLKRLRLPRLDLFFLHSNVVPDAQHIARQPDGASRMTLYDTFVADVRPAFERLVGEGLIGAWGLTGIGHPDTIIKLLGERPAPAAVQCIANLLDSPGALKFFDGPARGVLRIRHQIGMQEEKVEPRQAQPFEAAFDRLPQDGLDLGTRRIAEIALAADSYAFGQPAAKGLADDLFGLAVAITRGEVDQVDPGSNRLMHRGDAFIEGRLAPHHAKPAAAQGERRDRPEPAEAALLNQPYPSA